MTAIMENGRRADEFERTPPHDVAAEQCVLGGMLASKDAISDVVEVMKSGDYYRPAHQLIHDAILSLYEQGEPADPVAVKDVLARRGELGRVGNATYLHTLYTAVPTAANAGYYARIVRRHATLRSVIEHCTHGITLAYDGAMEPDEIADRMLRAIGDAVTPAGTDALPSFREILQETIADLESDAPRGIPLPWRDLDDLLLGLAPGQLIFIGARPGVGKTVVGADIAIHAALAGKPVLFMSAEMSRKDIALRVISAKGRVNHHALLGRNLTEPDWERVADAYRALEGIPLSLDDEPGPTVAHTQMRLREMDRKSPAEMLVVDYLQLMSAPAAENRQVAVADMGWSLKQIARIRKIPVVVLAQLNRNPELRTDKRPRKEDLRESGALEQHADVIILLHREDVYDPETVRAGEIDLIVDKNRRGPKGTVTAAFQGHYQCVMDMAPARDLR